MTSVQMTVLAAGIALVAATVDGRGEGGGAFSVEAVLVDDEALNRAHDVELQGDFAYVAGKGGSIAVIDVSDAANPEIVWSRREPEGLDDAETVLPMGDRLLLGTNDLFSIDIRDPRSCVIGNVVRDRDRIGKINGMVRRGAHVFAACKTGWVDAFDVSDPAAPALAGARDVSGDFGLKSPHDIDAWGDYVIVVDPQRFGLDGQTEGKVGILRVADAQRHELLPAKDWELAGLVIGAELIGANRVQVSGGHAFVSGSQREGPSQVVVLDIANPEEPKMVGARRFSDTRGPNGLTIAGKVLFVAGGRTVEAIAISRPEKPVLLGRFHSMEAFPADRDNAHDLVYRDGLLYVTAQNDNALVILRVVDPRIRGLAGER